jgi:hypothetical protein
MGYIETNQGDLNPHFSLSTCFPCLPVSLSTCLPVSLVLNENALFHGLHHQLYVTFNIPVASTRIRK